MIVLYKEDELNEDQKLSDLTSYPGWTGCRNDRRLCRPTPLSGLWTASTNECDGLIYAHDTATFSLVWSPDGSQLATGGGVIRIWDSQTGNQLSVFGLHETSIHKKLAWPKPDMLISLQTGYGVKAMTIIRFWDLKTGKVLIKFQGGIGELWQ
jgi:WD40 repeat protein